MTFLERSWNRARPKYKKTKIQTETCNISQAQLLTLSERCAIQFWSLQAKTTDLGSWAGLCQFPDLAVQLAPGCPRDLCRENPIPPFCVFGCILDRGPHSKSSPIFFSGNIFTSGFFYRRGLILKRSFLGKTHTTGPRGVLQAPKTVGGTVIFRDPDFLRLNWHHNDFDLDFLEKYEDFFFEKKLGKCTPDKH